MIYRDRRDYCSVPTHNSQMIKFTPSAATFFSRLYTGLFLIVAISACKVYSLAGTSIDPNIETFYVGNFKVLAANAPATIQQTFGEALKDKISRESRLQYSDEDPDIEFNGNIQSFNVSPVAPLPGERASFNRLTIQVSVEYSNNLNTKQNFTKIFSHFEDFDATENLNSVQDELITIIFNQIMEDIFNQAFNNW
ncbi:MAG TPA: LPS assembly lipoprotein LptE [Saprospiraceae bacterium]|nr:LPS assembly lipoprotein LptE [Saprospiraceae bacterium]